MKNVIRTMRRHYKIFYPLIGLVGGMLMLTVLLNTPQPEQFNNRRQEFVQQVLLAINNATSYIITRNSNRQRGESLTRKPAESPKVEKSYKNVTLISKSQEENSTQTVFQQRKSLLEKVCNKYNDLFRPEYFALYEDNTINRCTANYFRINDADYFICNILKGGLNSWKTFFRDQNITTQFIDSCKDSCPTSVEKRILQVRHPLERLVSAYRHVVEEKGYKSLDFTLQTDPELALVVEKKVFDKVTWVVFIRHVVLESTLKRRQTQESMQNYYEPNVWINHHWAPAWYTCAVCRKQYSPHFILKQETLAEDIRELLPELGLPKDTMFPRVRMTDSQDFVHSSELAKLYYSQLTKKEVMQLHALYRLDFEMFDYSVDPYLEMAQS